MMFARRLRDGIRQGRITCSVRIWKSPRVKPGGSYPMDGGHVVVDAIRPIALSDVTGELARRSGFAGVVDLLKTAIHGSGTNVYLVDFHYVPPAGAVGSVDHGHPACHAAAACRSRPGGRFRFLCRLPLC